MTIIYGQPINIHLDGEGPLFYEPIFSLCGQVAANNTLWNDPMDPAYAFEFHWQPRILPDQPWCHGFEDVGLSEAD